MTLRTLPLLVLVVSYVASYEVRSAQQAAFDPPPPAGESELGLDDIRYRIPGTVVDLSRDSLGRILYCTSEGEVGRLTPGVGKTVLATAQSGPFPLALRGVAENASGDVAVVDTSGDLYVLHGGATPADQVYDDVHMIQDATDLLIDAGGNFLVASATPSSGFRAVNWISSDGGRWGYYLVRFAPVQLAHDPLTGGILIADAAAGGNLQLVTAGSQIRATSAIDTFTHPGIGAAQNDGDVAAEADGDLYWIAGGTVRKHTRETHSTALFASGYGQLRGIVIAPSSGLISLPGWSLYLAEGANRTVVREIPGVDAPGDVLANDQGWVPGRGIKVNVNFGFQAFDMATDDSGRLLLAGTFNYGASAFVKRVTLSGTPSIATVATSANGLEVGVLEGVCVAPDDSLYVLSRTGTIQHITEGPLSVTTVFTDPLNQITAGKDMALDVNGTLYVACRESYGFGEVLGIAGGIATQLVTTQETRALAANPLGGMFVSQWHNVGFNGTVDLLHFSDNSFEALPGFSGINYANDVAWADGDLCVDVNGTVYSISEDDWSLVCYYPSLDGFVRIGSGYLNRPSGVAIAPSTASSGSTTGWSLYASEWDNLWEKPSMPAPASTLVNSSLGLSADRTVAGVPDPGYGKPRVLASDPRNGRVLMGTSTGWVLSMDPATGAIEPVAGEAEGLRGDLVALEVARDGRILTLDREGRLFELGRRRAQLRSVDPERLAPVFERALAAPVRRVRWHDPLEGSSAWLVLDGWVVWRTTAE